MAKKQPFVLVYAAQAKDHLRDIDRKYHSMIRESIESQLSFEPEVETRNRKPLERTMEIGAAWELRLGPDNRFRVFYSTKHDKREVEILAIGIKERNRLFIGGKEIKS
jgi:mRNA-degrading endonuclease RelE of RelBE toxin-antitoxin system